MQKRLYRLEEGKMLFGVCAGIAEYFKIDPTVVRLAWAIFCCMGGSGIPAYIIAMIIMPVKPLGIE
jgi:phage shock protein C